jgi:hypothetical protein
MIPARFAEGSDEGGDLVISYFMARAAFLRISSSKEHT